VSYTWLVAAVYVAGIVWCILVSDARPAERVMLALLWPLGPLALVVTVSILLVASAIAYPLVVVPVLTAMAVLCWALW
jgi:hypothetical protein